MTTVKTKTLNYIYFTDPGHGWMQVPMEDLKMLGIEDKITLYSYIEENYAYLEEDCDVAALFQAAKDKGIEITYREISNNDYSPIRKYRSYGDKSCA